MQRFGCVFCCEKCDAGLVHLDASAALDMLVAPADALYRTLFKMSDKQIMKVERC